MGPRALLRSPRWRRRFAWLTGVLVVIGLVVGLFALVPSQGGPTNGVRRAPPVPGLGDTTRPTFVQPETPAAARARAKAERTVRPLAIAFVDDLLRRHDLARAYGLLDADLQKGASLHDWQTGHHLPLSVRGDGASATIAFSGATTVGIVSAIGTNVLFAMRFDKTNGRWLIAYLHQGHPSAYVDETNYAPAGFSPGSRTETLWTWLALIGGLLAVIAVAVFVEQRLRGSRK
jgi:hypothetical protein